jgi:hypothetical protein
MKTLTLHIKGVFYKQILEGTKDKEYREIKPTTFKKMCRYLVDGEEFEDLDDIPDEPRYNDFIEAHGFDITPIKYDALKPILGYPKKGEEDSISVEVTSADIEYFVDEETREPIYYEYKGNEYIACQMVYSLGKILEVQKFKL